MEIKPIVLKKHPNWPDSMKCEECGYPGYMWLGITQKAYDTVFKKFTSKKCHKCGCGIVKIGEGLPVFILSNSDD